MNERREGEGDRDGEHRSIATPAPMATVSESRAKSPANCALLSTALTY